MGSNLLGLALLAGLLGHEHGLDVGQHATRGDGDLPQQLAQLLVVAHGQLDVAGHDAGLLVVTGCVAGQLQHLGHQVAGDAAHGEGQASLAGAAHCLLAAAALAATGWGGLGGLGLGGHTCCLRVVECVERDGCLW
ncbi:uncharacterized protein HaLaN_23830 [Haematococcus lacustris]|uniref:Secreted protein n=1 Tax=Haematococcus lacustris TaxID=44745 RepID=A0A6A0A4K8_HAELA|nr:uncharacterized protein HaLaN_23830 [Haematococcus lacustris]